MSKKTTNYQKPFTLLRVERKMLFSIYEKINQGGIHESRLDKKTISSLEEHGLANRNRFSNSAKIPSVYFKYTLTQRGVEYVKFLKNKKQKHRNFIHKVQSRRK